MNSADVKDWYSLAELAALNLPDMPLTARGMADRAKAEGWQSEKWHGERWRKRVGRGGGLEFTAAVLPKNARVQLMLRDVKVEPNAGAERRRQDMWAFFESLPEAKRDTARNRLAIIGAVEKLQASGMNKTRAVAEVSRTYEIAKSTINRWFELLHGLNRCDWLAALVPHHVGAEKRTDVVEEALQLLAVDYLRPSQPSLSACLRRMKAVAEERGWMLPSDNTLRRRIKDIDHGVVVLKRKGKEAASRLYPAQERDRSMLHALEAVNADGHKWDVNVEWPDGTIGRPVMVAFQDLYSNMILSWRVDRTENVESVRLAFGDMVEQFGIPARCTFDNGRNFAAKELTGGQPNRFRFKITKDDPLGILTDLGVRVDWTTPYSGQSKPIERAFRDFAGEIAKHPEFEGAYVGNSPMNKPANYGSKTVTLDTFLRVVKDGIDKHNTRTGRRTRVCHGKLSFCEAFITSYKQSPIAKPTEEQKRLWLLPSRPLKVTRKDHSIWLEGNRFWHPELVGLAGTKVVARYDPQSLHDDLHVYRLDGSYLCRAECQDAVGFHDADAARTYTRGRKKFLRALQDQADAELQMTLAEAVAAQPKSTEQPEPPEARVVRLLRPRSNTSAAQDLYAEEQEDDRVTAAWVQAAKARAEFKAVFDDD